MNTQTIQATHNNQPGNNAPSQQPAGTRHAGMAGANFFRLVSAEFRKIFSLRSSWILLATSVFLMVLFALLSAWSFQMMMDLMAEDAKNGGGLNMEADPQMMAIMTGEGAHAAVAGSGYQLALVLLASVAVLAAAGEFNTGAIRSTLLANPSRWQVLAAKALVIAVVGAAVMLAGLLLSHHIIWAQMADHDVAASFFAPDQWWQYMMIILFTVAMSWLGLGLGFLIRNSAGAIVTLLMIVILLPIVWMLLPGETMQNIGGYLPTNLMATAVPVVEPDKFPSRLAAMGLFMGWGVLGLIAGGTRFATSDVK